jgi:Ala-tRNA(Pro) hydrolase (EC 3.1.1.-)
VLHLLDSAEGLNAGDAIHGSLDWNRRYALMRLHTALHVMDAVVVKSHNNGQITGGDL